MTLLKEEEIQSFFFFLNFDLIIVYFLLYKNILVKNKKN
jgi:hypothetical protein